MQELADKLRTKDPDKLFDDDDWKDFVDRAQSSFMPVRKNWRDKDDHASITINSSTRIAYND